MPRALSVRCWFDAMSHIARHERSWRNVPIRAVAVETWLHRLVEYEVLFLLRYVPRQ